MARAFAQNIPPGFRQFTADDGLPSSEVYEVIQDSKGFLWFGTDNGISRYNGYRFENFGALQGLSNPVVFHLQEDRNGKIWMQTLGGKIFYLENDSIYPFAGNQFMEQLKPAPDAVYGFYVDSSGTVYNSIIETGLVRCTASGACQHLFNKPVLAHLIYQVEDHALFVTRRDRSKMDSVRVLEREFVKKKFIPLSLFLQSGVYKQTFIVKDAPFTFNHLQCIYLKGERLLGFIGWQAVYFKAGKFEWQTSLPGRYVYCEENQRGEIHIGLDEGGGVLKYQSFQDVQKGKYTHLLKGLTVTHILTDRDGGQWFATAEAGVFYRPNPDMHIYNMETGFPSNYITAVAPKNGHELFLGFDQIGVSHFDSRLGSLTKLRYDGIRVFDLAYDTSHTTLWGATTYLQYFVGNRGVMLWDSAYSAVAGTLRYFTANKKLHFSPDRKALWASYHAGFNKIDVSRKRVLFSTILRFAPTRTYDVITTRTGHSYVANINGLFELMNDSLIPVAAAHPAFHARIEALEELADSTLVIGSKGYGVVFWKGDKIASLTEGEGLTANMVENLHVSANGTLWVGTLNGLNRIRWRWDKMPELKRLTIAHGLPSNEINKVATWGDTVWVATVNGLAQFVDKKTSNATSVQPIIASVLAAGTLLKLGDSTPIPFSENSLKINFFAVNFKMAGHIPYRYRMDNGNWAQTFNTSLDFPAVPYGSHRFEVQAQNEDGLWSEASSFHFYIKPPWYATWWFRGLAVAALASAVFGFYQYRTRQLKRENELQRQMTELERSALQAQMNPHFIFNCLNAIQHFIHQNDKEQAIGYLGSFARLVRGVLNASVTGRVTVEDEIRLLENYLALERLRFDHRFDYQVKAEEGLEIADIGIPPMLVQPYVENAVLHGISGRESGGKVEVMFREVEGLLEISVSDNGRGINNSIRDDAPKGHKSVGMGITQRRLELIVSKKNAATPIILENIMDENGNILGARVKISVPI